MNSQLKLLAIPMLVAMTVGSSMLPAQAYNRYNNNGYYQGYNRYYGNYGTFGQRHPYVQKAAIGAGGGALVGGLLAGDGYRGDGMVKGALLGAGAGLGYQYLKRQGVFNGRW